MQENRLTNIVFNIFSESNDLYNDVKTMLLSLPNEINSFIIYGKWNNDTLDSWTVHFNISQTDKFNGIKNDNELLEFVYDLLIKSKTLPKRHVIGYKQSDLNIILKQYKPLIVNLASTQHNRWKWLEINDLIQMCNFVICDLYYKHYYVHKTLIRKSFNNYVLMHIRKDKYKPIIVSLDYCIDEDEKLTIADTIRDEKLIQDEKDEYVNEIQCRILQEVKDIVIDFIGPRQYDQLLREYSNKQTTVWSRKLMQTIKAHLFEMGISSKSFNKYYN